MPSNRNRHRSFRAAPLVAALWLLMPVVAWAANHTVEARPNNTFSPSNLTIQVGDSVTFVNQGGVHNAVADDGSFRCANGCDGQGGDGDAASNSWSATVTFDDPGTIGYFCEVHGSPSFGMRGTIVVESSTPAEPGNLRFDRNSQSRSEGAASFNVAVNRVGGDDGAVSVDYATADGSAQQGVDYTPVSGTLNWADGDDATKTFQIAILDDDDDEPNETINVALSNPTGGAGLSTPSNATLTIQDDDDNTPQPGQVSFAATQYSVDESAGSASILVSRSGGNQGAVTVDYATSDASATAGTDYAASSGTLSWADGEDGTRSFDVDVIDDADEENDETVNLSLSNPTGGASLGTSSATLEIDDDDATSDCIDDDTTLCLRADKRFRVTVVWRDFEDNTGPGMVLDFTPVDSGLFWFFGPDNAEVLLKVLDGCPINGHFWFFTAATTNVEYTLTVTDTQADETRTYFNPLGERAAAVTDTTAFATCP